MEEEVIAPDRRRRHVTEADLDRAVRDAVATQELRGDMTALAVRFVEHSQECLIKHEEIKRALTAQDDRKAEMHNENQTRFLILQNRLGRLETIYIMVSSVIAVFAFMGTDVGKRVYHLLFQ